MDASERDSGRGAWEQGAQRSDAAGRDVPAQGRAAVPEEAQPCRVRCPGLIPESGRSPGEGNVNPLQYSCLENPMDGGAW